MKVNWSKTALNQLDKALDFLFENGFYSYAIDVEDSILSRVENLADNHQIYPVDKYKSENDGTYRAFEVNEYRVSYRAKDDQVKVLRIRHTSRKPKRY